MEYEIEKYEAYITMDNNKKHIHIISFNSVLCNKFNKLSMSKNPKVYIVKNRGGNTVYVGKSKQPISRRLYQGLNATGINGYHGYQWQDKQEITIYCVILKSITNYIDEAIEAELVYLIRKNKDKWPDYQTEIHFRNNQEARKIAEEIYKKIIN